MFMQSFCHPVVQEVLAPRLDDLRREHDIACRSKKGRDVTLASTFSSFTPRSLAIISSAARSALATPMRCRSGMDIGHVDRFGRLILDKADETPILFGNEVVRFSCARPIL